MKNSLRVQILCPFLTDILNAQFWPEIAHTYHMTSMRAHVLTTH